MSELDFGLIQDVVIFNGKHCEVQSEQAAVYATSEFNTANAPRLDKMRFGEQRRPNRVSICALRNIPEQAKFNLTVSRNRN